MLKHWTPWTVSVSQLPIYWIKRKKKTTATTTKAKTLKGLVLDPLSDLHFLISDFSGALPHD